MRFTIRKAALIHAIQTVSKAVAVRTTKQVLSGILLELTDNALTATAYDLELGIQITIPATEETGLTVLDTGSIVLPARYFSDVVRKLPSDEVSIQISNNYMTEIRSGQANFHLHGIDAAEFPKLPTFFGSASITCPSDMLRELIRATAFAVSNSEVRPILTGIHLQLKENKLTFTGTDGLRLATRSVILEGAGNHDWNIVIPGKSFSELAKILPEDDTAVTMQFTESHSLFVIGNMHFYTRLIDGMYPDTSRIIPNSYGIEVKAAGDEIIGAIDRAALIARDRDNHMVRVELTGDTFTVSSSSPEIGNVSETVGLLSKEGPDLEIAFNARYVLDALRALNAAEVRMFFNNWNQPFVLRQDGNEFSLQLISPVLWR